MKIDEVLHCGFPSWYNTFKDVTIKRYFFFYLNCKRKTSSSSSRQDLSV